MNHTTGAACARIETGGQYVHEDEAAEHTLSVSVARYDCRVWTNNNVFETLFLTIFAISEAKQTIVE